MRVFEIMALAFGSVVGSVGAKFLFRMGWGSAVFGSCFGFVIGLIILALLKYLIKG